MERNNKIIPKGIKVIVVALLTLTTFITMPPEKVDAASPIRRGIMLGSEMTTQLNPALNTDQTDAWDGQYLYWGNDADVKWQILSWDTSDFGGGNGMLLLSGNIGQTIFDTTRNPINNIYVGSDLERYIDEKYNTMLSAQEKAVTLNSSNAGEETYTNLNKKHYQEAIFANKKWFAPTAHALFNREYGFHGDSTTGGDQTIQTNINTHYWLSSMDTANSEIAGDVYAAGIFDDNYVGGGNATRVLGKISTQSSVFVSAATGGKSANGVSSVLAPVSNSTSTEWKLTLEDSTQDINLTHTERKSATELEISYTKNAVGTNVGAIVVDNAGNVISYGHIAGSATTGTATVELPENFEEDNYQLKVFTENCYEDTQTDYASELKDVTVPAWYTINYELDGGINNTTNPLGFSQSSDTITFLAPTKAGNTFDGWYDAKTEGNKVTSIPKGTTGNKTIYARWIANDYTVKYDVNGGNSVAERSVKFEDKQLMPSPAPTKTGYTLVNWTYNGKTVNDQTKYSDLVSDDTVKEITLTANWTANNYTISFDSNGAEGSMSDLAMTYDVEKALTANSFTKEGYTFEGWKAESGDIYTNKEVVKNLTAVKDNTVILTAQWKADNYTITYQLDGGMNNLQNPVTYTINDNVTFLEPVKEGYTFDNWYDAKTEGNKVTSIPKGTTGNKTIYARWIANDYTVKYDVNGGNSVAERSVKFEDKQLMPLNAPTKTGYTLVSWTCNGKTVDDQTKYSDLVSDDTVKEITLKASWTANNYTIAFDGNGAEGSMSDLAMTYDVEKALTANSFTKEGYTFEGWKAESGDIYTNKEVVKNLTAVKDNTVILTAQWKAANYTITYQLVGGMNNLQNPVTYTINDNVTFLAPTKAGNTFDGWYDAQTSGNKVTSISKGTTGNITLYARYIINTYKVNFKDYDGTVLKIEEVKYKNSAEAPVTPTREGYIFAGWDKKFEQVIADMTITAVYRKSDELIAVPNENKPQQGGHNENMNQLVKPVIGGRKNRSVKLGTDVTDSHLSQPADSAQNKNTYQSANMSNPDNSSNEKAQSFVLMNAVIGLISIVIAVYVFITNRKKSLVTLLSGAISIGLLIILQTWTMEHVIMVDKITIIYGILLLISCLSVYRIMKKRGNEKEDSAKI